MSNLPIPTIKWLTLDLRLANERRRYILTTSLIGWVQALYQPCNQQWLLMHSLQKFDMGSFDDSRCWPEQAAD